MRAQLTNIQFLVGGLALILVAIVAWAAVLENRRKKKRQFPNYFCSNFDPSEFDQDEYRQGFFTEAEDLSLDNRSRLQAYEANNTNSQIGERE